MQIKSVYIVAMIAITLFSCKKDEEVKTLTGSWSSISFYTKQTINGVVQHDSTFHFTNVMSIIFRSDSTCSRSTMAFGEMQHGTYKIRGSELIFFFPESWGVWSDTAIYELSGDMLTNTYERTRIIDEDTTYFINKTTYKRE